MPIINPFLIELDVEARSTVRVLERVPADNLDWTPHPKSMTIGKLAAHIAGVPRRVEQLLRAGSFDTANAQPEPALGNDFVDTYKTNLASVREYLSSLDDATLQETFTMTRGEQTILQLPKIGVVRMILMNHTYHHRGQMVVYLRLLDIPVPAVYGTSADEGLPA
jgi:uncharacterized damage-inducible protein DinB